jgi:osmoprotectant transport system ATP-binding protein
MNPAIEFRSVTFTTSQSRSRPRTLLDAISFAIEEGTTTAVLGRSGSGKTTLLRTVNRMVQPTAGDVLVNNRSILAADVIPLRRGIGYVIQETGLFPHFTVARNAALVPEISGQPRAERNQRGYELLRAVGLDPNIYATRYPHQLSGGQRQRVGLARALAGDPSILLMDEPFGALDPLTRAEMQDMLRALLARLKKTVLLVTHDLDEALYLADNIVLLADGKLVAHLKAADFLASPHPEVQSYVQAFHRGSKSAAPSAPTSASGASL